MRSKFLPFSPPLIGQEEIDEVVDTLRSGWITTGPKTLEFERRFSAAFQSPAALATSSCTAAMHTALKLLEIGPGDEVITSGWTFAATANVIEHVGATPVLVDVEPATLNLDPKLVEAAVTRRTRAVIPVHFAGHPADLDAINDLAERHRLSVVEDAAHAVGAAYRDRPIGSGTNPAAFSFYATKNLATGEGGMLTGDPALVDQARVATLHGLSREAWTRYQSKGSWAYDVELPGFKYNMTDVQAALGLCQLARFDAMQARRREIAAAYQSAFEGLDHFELPVEQPHVRHAWHLYVVRLRPERLRLDRDRFIQELKQRNIGASVHFIPLPSLTFYRQRYGLDLRDFPHMHQNASRVVSLPLSPCLSEQDVADVIEAICDVASKFRVSRRAA